MAETTTHDTAATPYRWVILTLGILAYATSLFSRQSYAGVQRFLADDLHLDKAQLGVLASAFFYAYALFQMPWGLAADKYGSRSTTAAAILLIAATTVGFATAQTGSALLFWRVLNGAAAAALYATLAGGVARWFPLRERGFSQATFGGVGGALGEATAYFLMPVLSIYFASGWRQGLDMVAAAIAVVGVVCLLFLRNAPAGVVHPRVSFDWTLLGDPLLWSYTLLFSAFIVGLRGTQTWMVVYASDVYLSRGVDMNHALVAGGLLVTLAYSLAGRGLFCPLGGRLSDVLIKRGISRTALVLAWLATLVVVLQALVVGVTTTVAVALSAVLMGSSANMFPLVTAAVSDRYGPGRTGSIVGFVNTVAQLCGATALAISGYLGLALSAQPGNSLAEYRGVWLAAQGGVAALTVAGVLVLVAAKRARNVQ